jgi:hypothetical protein
VSINTGMGSRASVPLHHSAAQFNSNTSQPPVTVVEDGLFEQTVHPLKRQLPPPPPLFAIQRGRRISGGDAGPHSHKSRSSQQLQRHHLHYTSTDNEDHQRGVVTDVGARNGVHVYHNGGSLSPTSPILQGDAVPCERETTALALVVLIPYESPREEAVGRGRRGGGVGEGSGSGPSPVSNGARGADSSNSGSTSMAVDILLTPKSGSGQQAQKEFQRRHREVSGTIRCHPHQQHHQQSPSASSSTATWTLGGANYGGRLLPVTVGDTSSAQESFVDMAQIRSSMLF